MASVVFFRAVNVGLHQRFSPSALAKELSSLSAINIGAAGTLVVKSKISDTKLKGEILRRLSFEPELMICPAAEVVALADGKVFGKMPQGKDVKPFLSVMHKPLNTLPGLPIDYPAEGKWEVRIIAVVGRFVLTVRRPGAKDLYSNAVAEKQFAVPMTTRGWNTVNAIVKALAK